MKVRIEKKGDFFKQLIFDLSIDKFEFYTEDKKGIVLELPFKGFYDVIDNHLVILYKKEDESLSLKVDDFSFPVKEGLFVNYHVENAVGFLEIKDELNAILLKYSLAEIGPPVSTMYYTEDEEDVNFGLWVSNVLNSEERRRVLLDNW